MLGNFKESGKFLSFIASLIQCIKKNEKKKKNENGKKNHSFKIFSGISPPAALFKDKSFTISFKNYSETGLKENLLVIL